jgi:putative restriction endonuclease
LANLFKRPNSSVLAKMANLDGSRSNGGKFDQDVARILRDDAGKLGSVYREILHAARRTGVDARRLPDFLGIEKGGLPKDKVIY